MGDGGFSSLTSLLMLIYIRQHLKCSVKVNKEGVAAALVTHKFKPFSCTLIYNDNGNDDNDAYRSTS